MKNEYSTEIESKGLLPTLGPVYQTAGKFWPILGSEKAIIANSYKSLYVAVGFAALVLFLVTFNVYLTILSIICVIFIVTSIVAVIVL